MTRTLAMILAGGRVDELGILTYLRPKSTVPFGSLYRFIDFPLSNLMCSGIQRVGILSQYRSSSLVEHIGTGAAWDMVGRHRGITILPPFKAMHASDWYKGTADAVYQNLDFIASHLPDHVLILSGDHVYNMDYNSLIQFHLDMDADVTAAFVNVPMAGCTRFGLGKIAHDDPRGGRLIDYAEKPEKPISTWASMTIYLFNYKVLVEVLEENAGKESHEFGRDILPSLVSSYKIYGYKFNGYWAYCRTIEEYWKANMDLIGAHPRIDLSKWCLRTNLEHEAIRDRGPAILGAGSTVQGTVSDSRFYHGVRIEGRVERSILFPGVHISEGAVVRDSILFFDTQIGPGAQLDRVITDIGVSVGKDARLGKAGGEIVTVGMHAQIPQAVHIEEGSSIHPKTAASHFSQKHYDKNSTISPSHT
ncbi:MAG: glucose-1-phosphate adenylyltransferase [Thermodesulfobacteria bacterium]|nr:glucose-1-phosphate adenylyltransferase [Thermodesulfobacteriota bacterium]